MHTTTALDLWRCLLDYIANEEDEPPQNDNAIGAELYARAEALGLNPVECETLSDAALRCWPELIGTIWGEEVARHAVEDGGVEYDCVLVEESREYEALATIYSTLEPYEDHSPEWCRLRSTMYETARRLTRLASTFYHERPRQLTDEHGRR